MIIRTKIIDMNLVLIAFSTKYGSNFIKLLNGLQTKDLLEQNKKICWGWKLSKSENKIK